MFLYFRFYRDPRLPSRSQSKNENYVQIKVENLDWNDKNLKIKKIKFNFTKQTLLFYSTLSLPSVPLVTLSTHTKVS